MGRSVIGWRRFKCTWIIYGNHGHTAIHCKSKKKDESSSGYNNVKTENLPLLQALLMSIRGRWFYNWTLDSGGHQSNFQRCRMHVKFRKEKDGVQVMNSDKIEVVVYSPLSVSTVSNVSKPCAVGQLVKTQVWCITSIPFCRRAEYVDGLYQQWRCGPEDWGHQSHAPTISVDQYDEVEACNRL